MELVRPLEGSGGPLPRKLDSSGEGMFMLALTVRDAEESVSYLRDKGWTVTDANQGAFISPKTHPRPKAPPLRGLAAAERSAKVSLDKLSRLHRGKLHRRVTCAHEQPPLVVKHWLP